jgi:pimeloyl-ACP methyl ester carboxylesterase
MRKAFVTIDGVRIEYERLDGAGGRDDTIVLLHEGLGSVAAWRDYPATLAQATGWRVVVYSRRGYGWSDPIPAPRAVGFMHDEALVVLPALLDALGVDRPLLVGHSDGGSIALIHAGGSSRPVRGVVTLAAHVFVEDLTIQGIVAANAAFAATDLRERLGRTHRDAEATFRGWCDIWLDPAFRDWNIEAFLPRITCPVLAIQGLDDQYGTSAQVEAIRRGVGAKARGLLIPACRHSPHREQEAATTAAIVGFVRELEQGGR